VVEAAWRSGWAGRGRRGIIGRRRRKGADDDVVPRCSAAAIAACLRGRLQARARAAPRMPHWLTVKQPEEARARTRERQPTGLLRTPIIMAIQELVFAMAIDIKAVIVREGQVDES
jgi:hypothetical protein